MTVSTPKFKYWQRAWWEKLAQVLSSLHLERHSILLCQTTSPFQKLFTGTKWSFLWSFAQSGRHQMAPTKEMLTVSSLPTPTTSRLGASYGNTGASSMKPHSPESGLPFVSSWPYGLVSSSSIPDRFPLRAELRGKFKDPSQPSVGLPLVELSSTASTMLPMLSLRVRGLAFVSYFRQCVNRVIGHFLNPNKPTYPIMDLNRADVNWGRLSLSLIAGIPFTFFYFCHRSDKNKWNSTSFFYFYPS